MSRPTYLEGSDDEEIVAYKRLHAEEGDEDTTRANDGIKRSLDGFRMSESAPFIETLAVSVSRKEVPDANDEMTRELAFYHQAFAAVEQAREKLDDAGVQHRKPDSYSAAMVKDEALMDKVRAGLELKQHRADESLKRQKLRELKRFSKQVQRARLDEKQKKKKGEMEKLTQWRKAHKKGGAGGFDIEQVLGGDGMGVGDVEDRPRKKKHQAHDAKHGFGGKKRGLKRNTTESSMDMGTFNPKHNRSSSFGKSGRGGKRARH